MDPLESLHERDTGECTGCIVLATNTKILLKRPGVDRQDLLVLELQESETKTGLWQDVRVFNRHRCLVSELGRRW